MEKLIVCRVFEDSATLNAVNDLYDSNRKWSGDYAIVAAIYADPDAFCRIAHIPRLPKTVSLSRAAELFRNVGIVSDARGIAIRQLRRLGSRALPILAGWESAIASG